MDPKKRPRPPFHRRRVEPEVARLIDGMAGDRPELRDALLDAIGAIDNPDFIECMARTPAHHRAMLLLAWRDAVTGLLAGKPCDFCPGPARRVRFLAIRPGEDLGDVQTGAGNALVGFNLVCAACAQSSDATHKRRAVERYAAVQAEHGPGQYRTVTLLGPKIGEPGDLPLRRSLQPCADCRETVWIDQDAVDRVRPDTPLFLCRGCAKKRHESGLFEFVPGALVDLA